MLHSLSGKLILKTKNFAVIEAAGIGFKILISSKTVNKLPKINSKAKLFCYLNIKQEGAEIYGFLSEKELQFFELITSVSGIGPKSAISILGKLNHEKLSSAIKNKKIDLISGIAGIGSKKAERIILELKDKIKSGANASLDDDFKDIQLALKGLGYGKSDIESVLEFLSSPNFEKKKIEEKLKSGLKFLFKKA